MREGIGAYTPIRPRAVTHDPTQELSQPTAVHLAPMEIVAYRIDEHRHGGAFLPVFAAVRLASAALYFGICNHRLRRIHLPVLRSERQLPR